MAYFAGRSRGQSRWSKRCASGPGLCLSLPRRDGRLQSDSELTSKFSGPIIPVIYNVNLLDPAGYFLAANFEIRNKDIIYTANAISVDVTKFLNFLRTIMATADDPMMYATNYYSLLSALKGRRRQHIRKYAGAGGAVTQGTAAFPINFALRQPIDPFRASISNLPRSSEAS